MRALAYASLVLLYLLHTDIWYWDDPRLLLGLPIGFTYHVIWTLAVSVALWLTVRHAWPEELEAAAAGAGVRAGHEERTAAATGDDEGTGAGRGDSGPCKVDGGANGNGESEGTSR